MVGQATIKKMWQQQWQQQQ
jgi:hypothetical protein